MPSSIYCVEYEPADDGGSGGEFDPSAVYIDGCAVIPATGEIAPGEQFTVDLVLRNENDQTAECSVNIMGGGFTLATEYRQVSGVTGERDTSVDVPTAVLPLGTHQISAELSNISAV